MRQVMARRAERALIGSSLALSALLAGCTAGMSGLGGQARYGCEAPAGTACASVSAVHAASLRRADVPGSIAPTVQPALPAPVAAAAAALAPALPGTEPAGAPESQSLRSAPRVLRLWVAPWEDADGDLHEASTVHVVVDHGRWLIERVRPTGRSGTPSVRAPLGRTPGTGQGAVPPAAGSASPAQAPGAPYPAGPLRPEGLAGGR